MTRLIGQMRSSMHGILSIWTNPPCPFVCGRYDLRYKGRTWSLRLTQSQGITAFSAKRGPPLPNNNDAMVLSWALTLGPRSLFHSPLPTPRDPLRSSPGRKPSVNKNDTMRMVTRSSGPRQLCTDRRKVCHGKCSVEEPKEGRPRQGCLR